jgi:cytochrome P450
MTDSDPRASVDFDHHSPRFWEDPYGAFRWMRESGCPIAYSAAHGGFWAFVEYAPVMEATRDDALFSSCPSIAIPASPVPFPILPIETDRPETNELRAVTLR